MSLLKSLRLPVLVAAALVVSATGAQAAVHPGSATIVTADVTVAGTFSPPGNIDGTAAMCPVGQKVVAGGAYFHVSGQGRDASLGAYLSSSAPKEDASGWFAAGINWSGNDLVLTVVAHCRPAAAISGFVAKTADVLLAADQSVGKKVGCGTGKRVLTGGAYTHRPNAGYSPDLESYLKSSGPNGTAKAFYVSAFNDHPSDNYRLHVTVLCLPTGSLNNQVVKVGSTTIGATSNGEKSVPCPSGKSVTAGGVRWWISGSPAPVTTDLWLKGAVPINSGASYWVAGGNGTGGNAVMKVRSVCLPS